MSEMIGMLANVICAPVHMLTTSFNFVTGANPEPKPITKEDLQSNEKRMDYTKALFNYYNNTVFGNKLVSEWVPVFWNPRLMTTAGRCLQGTLGDKKIAVIQLSTKICDNWERIRDTLVHEMCHAATWMVDDIRHSDHNNTFCAWGQKVTATHPDIPRVEAYHSYTIFKPFTYQCLKCGHKEGRHTDSLDTKKTTCRLCGGHFERVKAPRRDESRRKGRGDAEDNKRVSKFVAKYLRRKRLHAHLSQRAVMDMLVKGPKKGVWVD